VPRFCFVNKLDRTGADFWRVVDMIRERLGATAVPVQLPIGTEGAFRGVIDLLEMQAITYGNDLGDLVEVGEIPAELAEDAATWRDKLVEALGDLDDDIAHRFLEGQEVDADALRRALRAGTLASKIIPVLCGSALKNKGVQPMLDAVIEYLPSPLDVAAVIGTDPRNGEQVTRHADPAEPFAALAFKIAADPFVGKLAFFRVYSGTLKSGSYVYNATKGEKERIGRLIELHANHREEIESVSAGDIAAAVGLKTTFTGDTLCDESKPIILEAITFPEPVIELAVEPKTKADQDKMAIALQRLGEEDPTFRVSSDEESGQTRIAGMGELHLEVIVDRMLREFKVQANVGRPQVSYRETIRKPVKAEGRFVRQTGGKGQYGHAVLTMEPLERGGGVVFESKVVGGAVPREFWKPIEQGVRDALAGGVVAGFPVIDLKATLIDGSFHEVDSSEMAFKIAGSMAAKDGVAKADPAILEPVMKVEVVAPEEYMGDVIGNLNSKRGHMDGIDERGSARVIRAHVPLAEMFGYATELRSMTQGRATYSMEFSRYSEVPTNLANELIAKSKS
ncbi:MAG: elongation factor G, partial [Chloroflexota bacterium]